MPPDFFNNNRVQGIAFSAILAFSNRHVDCGRWFSFSFDLKVKNTKDCSPHNTQIFQSRVNYIESNHLHFGYYLFCEEDFNGFWKCNCIPEVVQFNVFPSLECECCGLKKCGIHLLRFLDSTNSIEDPSTCFNYNEEDWDFHECILISLFFCFLPFFYFSLWIAVLIYEIIEDALRIQPMDHVDLVAGRWKEVREKVCLNLSPYNLYLLFGV